MEARIQTCHKNKETETNRFPQVLPVEITLYIISFLEDQPKDLVRLSLVDKAFQDLVGKSKTVWLPVFLREYGVSVKTTIIERYLMNDLMDYPPFEGYDRMTDEEETKPENDENFIRAGEAAINWQLELFLQRYFKKKVAASTANQEAPHISPHRASTNHSRCILCRMSIAKDSFRLWRSVKGHQSSR